eukprot:s3319_g9.t1
MTSSSWSRVSRTDVLSEWRSHNAGILSRLRPGPDDQFLLEQSVKDADKGLCCYPLTQRELLEAVGEEPCRLIPRCVITQASGKQRVIDDAYIGLQSERSSDANKLTLCSALRPAQHLQYAFAYGYSGHTGLLFGLPLAVTSFNRYSRLVEALCRRFSFCMASLFFDDAHVTDRKSCRGSGQQSIQHLNKCLCTPFSEEKCQRMQASGTFLGLDNDFAQVHTAGLIRFWARARIQQKLEGLMQTAESSERLTPGVAAKIYGIANFFEQGVWGP